MHRNLTSTGCLAVTAMIDLALRSQSAPVTIASISRRQHVSTSYLEQVFGKLRRHHLVEATRGPGGGYSLGRDPADISVADIIVSVDKPLVAASRNTRRSRFGETPGRGLTHEMLAGLNAKLLQCLQSISLKELVDDQIDRGVPVEAAPIRRGISTHPVVKPIRVTGPNSVFALGDALSR